MQRFKLGGFNLPSINVLLTRLLLFSEQPLEPFSTLQSTFNDLVQPSISQLSFEPQLNLKCALLQHQLFVFIQQLNVIFLTLIVQLFKRLLPFSSLLLFKLRNPQFFWL
jgi:hypothetical protein